MEINVTNIMNILITLTSSMHVGQEYIDLTHTVVGAISSKEYGIVYGGTDYGMMKELGETYKNLGGKKLTGIMAKDLMAVTKGYIAYPKLDQSFILDTMSGRKDKMLEISDSFLILPGGYGTIDELITIVGGKVNKLYDKPIAILNHNGFYDSLITFFDELQQKEFSKIKLSEVVYVSDDINKILNYFENYQPQELADKFV